MKNFMSFVTIERKLGQQRKILLENCEDYYKELEDFAVYLKEESHSDVLEYIEQHFDQNRHCKEIFDKQPLKVMQMIAKREGILSYTERYLTHLGMLSLIQTKIVEEPKKEGKQTIRERRIGKKLEIEYYPVEAIELPNMGRKSEPFTQLIQQAAQEIGSTILPVSCFEAYLKQLVMKEVESCGVQAFLFSKEVRNEVIERFKTTMAQNISATGSYQESLVDTMEWNGEQYSTLRLSKQEWSMLCSLFRTYHACVYQTEQGDFLLTAGMENE